MKIYFAPMEGVTDGIFRQAHNRIFGGIVVYCERILSDGEN